MHEASLKIPVRDIEPAVVPTVRAVPRKSGEGVSEPAPRKLPDTAKSADTKPAAAKTAKTVGPKAPAKDQKAGDKSPAVAAKPVTKPTRTAKVDPLAPLPASAKSKKTTGNSGTAR
jgi:hypothetical protein